MLKEFVGAAPQRELTATLSSATGAGGTFTVDDGTGYPTGATAPFVVVLNRGISTEEKILCSNRSGTTFTIQQRGYDDTLTQTHNNGSSVHHAIDADTISEANQHANEDHFNAAEGTIAARPAADGTRGLYRATDQNNEMYVDVAGSWHRVAMEEDVNSRYVQFVVHAADPNVARPTGAGLVLWIGSVEPSNAQDNDIYVTN